MNSERLAQEIATIITLASDRIVNVGKVQYEYELGGGTTQNFEIETLAELQQGILEEIEDTINHLCMLHIRVRRIGEKADRLVEVPRDPA